MRTGRILITSIILLGVLYIFFGGGLTGRVVGIQNDFVCGRNTVETDILRYTHTEDDYNRVRLCCEVMGGYWFDATDRLMVCSSMFKCSGYHNPNKPYPHCVLVY